MKVKERQEQPPQGRDAKTRTIERVIEVEEVPEGTVRMPDGTPLSDWAEVPEAE